MHSLLANFLYGPVPFKIIDLKTPASVSVSFLICIKEYSLPSEMYDVQYTFCSFNLLSLSILCPTQTAIDCLPVLSLPAPFIS